MVCIVLQVLSLIFFKIRVGSEVYQEISVLEGDECHCCLQQDGSTCYASSEALDFLKEYFDNCLISECLCPTRSPDLSPTDFFHWGHLKGYEYQTNSHTLEELRPTLKLRLLKLQVHCYMLCQWTSWGGFKLVLIQEEVILNTIVIMEDYLVRTLFSCIVKCTTVMKCVLY